MTTVVVVVGLAVTLAVAAVTGMQPYEKEQGKLDLHLDQQELDLSNYTTDVNNRNERCGF